MKPITLAFAALLVLVGSASASSKVMQFLCTYPKSHNWGGTPDQEAFVLKFAMDTVTRKAFIIGNQGVEDVTVIPGSAGITFVEILETGAVQTTTVSPKNGASVHSRHSLMGGDILPSQYVGPCTVE